MKKIFIIVSLVIFCLCISGCKKKNDLKIYEDFKYYLFDDIAYIYELSEEGKTKDAIIFPSIIENYKTGLGVKFGIMIPNKVILESNNIASIYFNSDIIIDTYRNNAVYFSITDIENIRIFLPNTSHLINEVESRWNDLYYSNEFYNKNKDIVTNLDGKIANVSYYYNYEKEFETFFIDDVDGDKIKNIPPVPQRIGYEFSGWYKEKECINKWDFANDIVPAKVYNSDNEYQYQETKLYAKWEKLN